MHELAITQSVVTTITQRMRDAPVRRIRLEVGRLSGLVPDSVRFCFTMVAAGTTCEGARLEIEEPEGVGRCRACGSDFTLPDLILLCPCGSADVQLLSGRELSLKSVEVAEHV